MVLSESPVGGRKCAPSRGAAGVPGKPGGFAPPILFFLEKENASRPVEEKIAWAAAFQAPPETPFPACYEGFGGADLLALSIRPHTEVSPVGGAPGCSLLLFCCRSPVVAEDWQRRPGRFRNCQGAAAKRGGRGIRDLPTSRLPQMPGCGSEKRRAGHPGGTRTIVGVKGRHRRQSPQITAGPTPRNRRCERFRRSLKCRRQRLFS